METRTHAPDTPAARRTCRRKGCQHEECRREANLYQKRRQADAALGRTRRVPISVARRVLEARRAELGGVTSNHALARALGVSEHTLRHLESEKASYVEIDTFRRLQGPLRAEPARVPAAATRLRIQALQAEGHRGADLAASLRCHPGLYAGRAAVGIDIAKRVIRLMQELGEGPSQQARTIALNKGWRPRSAYDQDLLLDPLWDGEGGLIHSQLTRAEAEEELWFLIEEAGASPEDAARRIGRSLDWVRARLREREGPRG